MPFTAKNYPNSWKNFYAKVRYKAIEIANALIEDEKMPEGRAIAIATDQAKDWADKRGLPVKKGE